MTPDEQLDRVLNILNEQYVLEFQDAVIFNGDGNVSKIYKSIKPKSRFLDFNSISLEVKDLETRNELDIILGYLIDNKFVSNGGTTYTTTYGITFLGRKLLKDGGFVGKSNRINAENTRIENVEKSQMANEKQMIYLTAVLAVFAFASLCKDVAVLIMDKDKKFVAVEMTSYSFIFLFGLIAGIIIYLLISEGVSRRKREY